MEFDVQKAAMNIVHALANRAGLEWTPAIEKHWSDRLLTPGEADRIWSLFKAGELRIPRRKLYVIGSLRNEAVPALAQRLRGSCPGVEIFDDWYAAGPRADDHWKEYERFDRENSYTDALKGYSARHVFEFDKHHLDTSTHALLVLPAGKSGHMELMYAAYAVGADTAILLEQNADPRWDVMYQFIPNVFETVEQVEEWLNKA